MAVLLLLLGRLPRGRLASVAALRTVGAFVTVAGFCSSASDNGESPLLPPSSWVVAVALRGRFLGASRGGASLVGCGGLCAALRTVDGLVTVVGVYTSALDSGEFPSLSPSSWVVSVAVRERFLDGARYVLFVCVRGVGWGARGGC